MKTAFVASLALGAAVTALRAAPTDSAIVAAMKLPDATNYTWSTTVDDDARSYGIDGQTDRASDYSLVTMPLVAAARHGAGTGTSYSGNLSNLVFQGDEKFVVQVNTKWKNAKDLAADAAAADSRYDGYGYPGWGGGMRHRRGWGGMSPPPPPPPPSNDSDGSSDNNSSSTKGKTLAYSNLQKTLCRPHEELAIIVAGANDLKIDGDIVSGTLNDTAAKLLLVHAGQKEITPLAAAGTFRFWLKDGVLVKYEVKLEGKLAVKVNGDRHEVEVHQTALTEIKNVGTTKFDVPDDAKKKLGA